MVSPCREEIENLRARNRVLQERVKELEAKAAQACDECGYDLNVCGYCGSKAGSGDCQRKHP